MSVDTTLSFRYWATLLPASVMSLVEVARTATDAGSSYRYTMGQQVLGMMMVPEVFPEYI